MNMDKLIEYAEPAAAIFGGLVMMVTAVAALTKNIKWDDRLAGWMVRILCWLKALSLKK